MEYWGDFFCAFFVGSGFALGFVLKHAGSIDWTTLFLSEAGSLTLFATMMYAIRHMGDEDSGGAGYSAAA